MVLMQHRPPMTVSRGPLFCSSDLPAEVWVPQCSHIVCTTPFDSIRRLTCCCRTFLLSMCLHVSYASMAVQASHLIVEVFDRTGYSFPISGPIALCACVLPNLFPRIVWRYTIPYQGFAQGFLCCFPGPPAEIWVPQCCHIVCTTPLNSIELQLTPNELLRTARAALLNLAERGGAPRPG
jgi:hypothetical protein